MPALPVQLRTSKVIPITGIPKWNVMKMVVEPPTDIHAYPDTIAIATKGKIDMIVIPDIKYVSAESNYIRFYLKDDKMILAAKTLKDVSGKLERSGFIRVHKSFMLHPSTVRQFDLNHGYLVLKGGEKIPVSRSNRKLVGQKLLTWSSPILNQRTL